MSEQKLEVTLQDVKLILNIDADSAEEAVAEARKLTADDIIDDNDSVISGTVTDVRIIDE